MSATKTPTSEAALAEEKRKHESAVKDLERRIAAERAARIEAERVAGIAALEGVESRVAELEMAARAAEYELVTVAGAERLDLTVLLAAADTATTARRRASGYRSAAWQALKDAGLDPSGISDGKSGITTVKRYKFEGNSPVFGEDGNQVWETVEIPIAPETPPPFSFSAYLDQVVQQRAAVAESAAAYEIPERIAAAKATARDNR